MRRNSLIMLGLSVVVVVILVLMGESYFKTKVAYVASTTIPAYTVVTPNELSPVALHTLNFSTLNGLITNESQIVGKMLDYTAQKGDLIQTDHITSRQSTGYYSNMIKNKGDVAITLSLTSQAALGGLLARGNVVDIIGLIGVTPSASAASSIITNSATQANYLQQNVLVLGSVAAGQGFSVTLEVTPLTAEVISAIGSQNIFLVQPGPHANSINTLPYTAGQTVVP